MADTTCSRARVPIKMCLREVDWIGLDWNETQQVKAKGTRNPQIKNNTARTAAHDLPIWRGRRVERKTGDTWKNENCAHSTGSHGERKRHLRVSLATPL